MLIDKRIYRHNACRKGSVGTRRLLVGRATNSVTDISFSTQSEQAAKANRIGLTIIGHTVGFSNAGLAALDIVVLPNRPHDQPARFIVEIIRVARLNPSEAPAPHALSGDEPVSNPAQPVT